MGPHARVPGKAASMLEDFIREHRAEIIARCRAQIASRPVPRATDNELEFGVPLFLDQVAERLASRFVEKDSIADAATKHGEELLHEGFTIAQVVHDYGNVCQAITQLAVESAAPLSSSEFKHLNLCLDEAIAAAVTEYARLREHEGTERLGRLAHELRNLLNVAVLSFETMKEGTVGLGGSTAAVHDRSLSGMRNLIDRELAEIRLGAGILHQEVVPLHYFIEDVEVAATMEARSHGVSLTVTSVDRTLRVFIDRAIMASVVANLLQNAFKYTKQGGHVTLRAHATADRVLIDVEDECGGLPDGASDNLFVVYEQRGTDRSGLGLGLSVCRRGVAANHGSLRVVDHPGTGCVFTVDLAKHTVH